MAFGSTLAHEQGYGDDVWAERAAGASAGCERGTFVAEDAGRWVGMVTVLSGAYNPDGSGPLLVAMFVDSAVRKTGVGHALVQAALKWGRSCGSTRITLWVTAGNVPAVRLYESCGFQLTGVRRPVSHTPEADECEMVLHLR
jgi:GNAT superfamily N-acetyltransferase